MPGKDKKEEEKSLFTSALREVLMEGHPELGLEGPKLTRQIKE
jgi:hypothetical protein